METRRVVLFVACAFVVAAWVIGMARSTPWTLREEQELRQAGGGEWFPAVSGGRHAVPDTQPLPHWAALASARLLGPNLPAMRLPGILLVLATLFVLWTLVRKIDGDPAGWMAALAAATSFAFSFCAVQATREVYGACFITLCFGFCYSAIETPARLTIALAFGSAALALLSIGVLAVLVPAAALAAFYVLLRSTGDAPPFRALLAAHGRSLAIAALVFALLLIPAYGAVIHAWSWSSFASTLIAQGADNEPSGRCEFYMRSFLVGLFPWSLLLPVAVLVLFGAEVRDAAWRRALFCLFWAVSGWSMVSVIPRKAFSFSVPVMPVFAVFVALVLARACAAGAGAWPKVSVFASALLSLLFLRDMELYTPRLFFDLFLGEESVPDTPSLTIWITLAAAAVMAAAAAAAFPKRRGVVTALFVVGAVCCLVLIRGFLGLTVHG